MPWRDKAKTRVSSECGPPHRGGKKGNLPVSFVRDATLSVIGSVVGRLVILASTPLITRIYDSEVYGMWAIVLTLSSFLLPLATWRYELPLVMTRARRVAEGLTFAIVVAGAICVAGVSIVGVTIPQSLLAWLTGIREEQQQAVLGVVPVLLIILVGRVVLRAWALREKRFGKLAAAEVVQAVVTTGIWLSLAILGESGVAAMCSGGVLGMLAGAIMLWRVPKARVRKWNARSTMVAGLAGIRRYRVYAMWVVPYSMSAGVAERVVQGVLGNGYSLAALGAFFMARQIAAAPAMLVSSVLRQVVFAHGAREVSKKILAARIDALIKILGALVAPVLAFSVIWTEIVAEWVFGERWPELPGFLWWTVMTAGAVVLSNWLDRVLDLYGQQRLGVVVQTAGDVALIAVALLGWKAGLSTVGMVAALAVTMALGALVWVPVVYQVMGYGVGAAGRIIARVVVVVAAWIGVQALVWIWDDGLVGLGIGVTLLGLAVALVMWRLPRVWHQAMGEAARMRGW